MSDDVMFSYDCQKNLVMECSKDKHNKENTFLYVWEKMKLLNEEINEITSAVYDRLCNTEFNSSQKKLRRPEQELFYDYNALLLAYPEYSQYSAGISNS